MSSLATWHTLATANVASVLATDAESGLTEVEAERRLRETGPNQIVDHRPRSVARMVLDQFRSLVVLLLLTAATVAWTLGERMEALAILAALVLNASIGFGFEWRARVSLARLRSLAVAHARVRRNGRTVLVAASHLVPGDVILLDAGSAVPADGRLLRSAALRVTEAPLTGESGTIDKDADGALASGTVLAERRNMVYVGSIVVAGSGCAAVTATGAATELGRIGRLIADAGPRTTPLERRVETLGRRLMILGAVICAAVGAVGVLHGEPIGLMLETAISLAVAVIPEGLPAIVSVALAAGLWRLARHGALVRRLPAVETLGSATVICADKTGTMTENQMTVTAVRYEGRHVVVGGGSRSASGSFMNGATLLVPAADPHLTLLLTVGALCNDASLQSGADGLRLLGDPTEAALLVAAVKAGLDPSALARSWPRRHEIPFDSAARWMATFHEVAGGETVMLVKGAPEVVIPRSSRQQRGAGAQALDEDGRRRLLDDNRDMAAEGLRVLALAYRPAASTANQQMDDLVFLGLVGLIDPVRPGVKDAIERCWEAGIDIVMLTGDQRITAETIGRQLGLSPAAIRSRMSPEGKLALVAELQAAGEIVAMTGDGVNDAPALVRADIGVAMGRYGTDVARESADLVLTDDNFATLANAVEEGRLVYANLRKVIHFIFSCNLSEILTIFVAVLIGWPSPLLPLQILWINLVTDILPAMALIRDPADPEIMRRPPRDPAEALVTWRFAARMLGEGALLAAGVLSAYFWVVWRDGVGPHTTTVAFTALVLLHPFQAMNCRSSRLPWWRLPPNPLVPLSLVALFLLQWIAIEWGPLAGLLGTVPLDEADWLVLAAGVLWPVLVLEGGKTWRLRMRRPSRGAASPPASDQRSTFHEDSAGM